MSHPQVDGTSLRIALIGIVILCFSLIGCIGAFVFDSVSEANRAAEQKVILERVNQSMSS